MVKRNPNLEKLQAGYLFPEINRRKKRVMEQNPDARIISLGIGNTTEPLMPNITHALANASEKMGTLEGYSGYGDEQGFSELRKRIGAVFYNGMISAEEVFVSDGAKCDIGRLQVMFGADARVALQDPAYPVYVDGSVIIGATGDYNSQNTHFEKIQYMPCKPENNFFPDLSKINNVDLIYFCSPNNPTGAVATKDQLKQLVNFAKEQQAIIVFDAAYSEFIQDKSLPKSIFEIEGAEKWPLRSTLFQNRQGLPAYVWDGLLFRMN